MIISAHTQRPLLRLSNSDISLHKRCPRKWTWQSFNRCNFTVKRPVPHLWIGTGCHAALEHWDFYGGTKSLQDAFNEWVDDQYNELQARFGSIPQEIWSMIDKAGELGRNLLAHYEVYARARDNFKFVAREYEFSVPIPNILISLRTPDNGPIAPWVIKQWGEDWINNEDFKKTYTDRGLFDAEQLTIPALFVGRLDGIIQMKSDPDQYFVIDHKFLARPVADETLLLDEQTAKYVWAAKVAHARGWFPFNAGMIRGCYYNVIIKKVPSIPKQNKNGTTSRAKILTTSAIFRNTLLERGENPADYAEQIADLQDSDSKFYMRHRIIRGKEEIALVGDRLHYEYLAMATTHSYGVDAAHPGILPSPTKDCAWECSFKHACYALNYGADANDILQETMMVSDRTYYLNPFESEEDQAIG